MIRKNRKTTIRRPSAGASASGAQNARAVEAARKASKEVFHETNTSSFAEFVRARVERIAAPLAAAGKATAKSTAKVKTEEIERLVRSRNWSTLEPRLRKELLARRLRAQAEARLPKSPKKSKQKMQQKPRRPVKRPVLPSKGGAKIPKPVGSAETIVKSPPGSSPLSGVPVPAPPDPPPPRSQPDPPAPPDEGDGRELRGSVGYFASISRFGYYTEEPPVENRNPVIYEFNDMPDGFLRLASGETWTSEWHEGEILRGINVDVVGDVRLNWLKNGDLSR